ncbi:MAG: Hsp20/alpha crystallin family protein [Chromatiaceae bacterium]|jgi:HSP20 family protein
MGEKEKKAIRTRPEPSTGELSPFDEMDRFFEDFIPRGWMRRMRRGWPAWADLEAPFEGRTPHVDVIERDEEVVVNAELPGVKKDDLEVSLAGDRLTIKATAKQEVEETKGEYHRREISRGEFTRTLQLPAAVDAERAQAKFADGILELTLPKAVPAKRHAIKVD